MVVLAIILAIVAILISGFALFAVWRLNKYIQYTVEERILEIDEVNSNLVQSLQLAVGEGLIKSNGRIKKPYMIKDGEI